MGKDAREEKPVYERPKLVELDTPSASGNGVCNHVGSQPVDQVGKLVPLQHFG